MAKSWTTRFDRFMVFAGLVNPLATIPQIIKVYGTHSEQVSGQSLTTWTIYTTLALLWVIYGAANRQLAVMVGNIFGTIAYAAVAIGIVIHAGITF